MITKIIIFLFFLSFPPTFHFVSLFHYYRHRHRHCHCHCHHHHYYHHHLRLHGQRCELMLIFIANRDDNNDANDTNDYSC